MSIKYKSKHEPWKSRTRKGESYCKEKILIRQYGRLVNLYKLIQSRNIDTEIYPTLKKYGSIKPMEITSEWITTGMNALNSIKDIDELNRAAENEFLNLPTELQAKFDYNYAKFAQYAQKKGGTEELMKILIPQQPKKEEKTENGNK